MSTRACLVLALALAGCAAPEAASPVPPPAAVEVAAEGCRETAVVVAVPEEAARTVVPAAYALDTLGLPVEDRALLVLAARACDGHAWTHVGFFVATPADAPDPGMRNFSLYEVASAVPDGALRARLGALGWPAVDGASTVATAGRTYALAYEDAQARYAFRGPVEDPAEPPSPVTVLAWNGEGRARTLLLADLETSFATSYGGAYEASPGSLLARLAGERGPVLMTFHIDQPGYRVRVAPAPTG